MLIGGKLDNELKGDRGIWLIFILLSLMSLLAVYSSTGTLAFNERNGNTSIYLIKHAVVLGFGLWLAYFSHLLHYLRFAKWAPYMLAITIPLLLFTLLWGVEKNDARRWLEVPVLGLSFQPSDFAKLALIIYLARTISLKQDVIKDFKKGFLPLILPVGLVCMLIGFANLSTAAILFFTCALMMFVGRVSIKHLMVLGAFGVVGLGMLFGLGMAFPENSRVATWKNRIQQFAGTAEEADTYQVDMAKIAIANGGWLGVGPGNSFQRNYIPYPYADFIYAVIIEEYGLLGGVGVLFLYVYLFYRCVKLVTRSPRAFGAMLAMGLSLLLMVQAFVNIAVSVNLMPVTGVTLPLISMGGSSIIFISIAVGIILSVSKHIEQDPGSQQKKDTLANEQA